MYIADMFVRDPNILADIVVNAFDTKTLTKKENYSQRFCIIWCCLPIAVHS